MNTYKFRLLNVFAESTFGGNPLCVFEDARDLDDGTMLALAAQFNLSETTFVLPSDCASARVRVFTPGYEMPFAGHPALGTAHVVRDIAQTGNHLTLAFHAGVVPLSANHDVWTFIAPRAGQLKTAASSVADEDIASLLGVSKDDLLMPPIWVNTGSDQLLVALNNLDAVHRACPDSAHLDAWPQNSLGRKTAYLFAFDPVQPGRVLSRYFFAAQSGGFAEDPGTGSACANLGGWLITNQYPLPMTLEITQGEAIGRPSVLQLFVAENGEIHVGGRVIELGRGEITL